ncbi:hypothetical protein [Sphingosinicella humi]|nr:hypothetical protein [Sphingosinicella humi]
MKRHTARDWSLEEFDAWAAACDREEAVARAADEEGGPRLSLVPAAEREEVWPADLLPPAETGSVAEHRADGEAAPMAGDAESLRPAAESASESAAEPPVAATPFDGVPLEDSRKRLAGWSAERQRLFLVNLAETGSVHLASATARLTARSAYRLRARSPAFASAWDTAQQLAVGRLSALAFDRAINGRTEQVWHCGELVAEKRAPSDKLLMWLLARLDPRRFAAPWELRKDDAADPQAEARESFPALLEGLTDLPS